MRQANITTLPGYEGIQTAQRQAKRRGHVQRWVEKGRVWRRRVYRVCDALIYPVAFGGLGFVIGLIVARL